MVRVAIFIPDIMNGWVAVDFLLDTGASTTSLHPLDAVSKVGIDPVRLAQPSRWSDFEDHGGIGGESRYFPLPARYAFLADDGSVKEYSEQIYIAQLTPVNQTLPSLLGWDLLQHFRLNISWVDSKTELEEVS